MTGWSPWRSVLVGAVIGFIDAAGSHQERRALRNLEPVIRFDDREPDAGRPRGLWFLYPLQDIRRYFSPN